MSELTLTDFTVLSNNSKNSILLFITMLFLDNIGAADLTQFEDFLERINNEFMAPKKFFYNGSRIERPRAMFIHSDLKTLTGTKFLDEINFNGHISWRISPEFSKLAHSLLKNITNEEAEAALIFDDESDAIIPAADRFVSTKDNQPQIDIAIQKLDELKDRIKNSNELKANTEERLALSQEVTALQDALKNSVVRLSSIWNAVKNNGVVAYLSTHGGDAVLNALAVEVVGHIFKAFQLS